MKTKLLIAFASVIIFGNVSPFAFANGIQGGGAQSLNKSDSNASVRSERDEIPIITNEAEYAEFQKQRELASRASSSLPAKSNTASSRSNKSKVTYK